SMARTRGRAMPPFHNRRSARGPPGSGSEAGDSDGSSWKSWSPRRLQARHRLGSGSLGPGVTPQLRTTIPRAHWIGQAMARIRPTRLVQGEASTRAACSGGTITQVFQTTLNVIRQVIARPTPKVVVNKEFWRGSLLGSADWTTALASQGIPSRAQRRS